MPNNTTLDKSLVTKYTREITAIRNFAKYGKLITSDHAFKQLSQRGIRYVDVIEAIKKGTLIEIQTKERDIKFVFQDITNLPPLFFAVVAYQNNAGMLVTAYYPDLNIWILDHNNWRRK